MTEEKTEAEESEEEIAPLGLYRVTISRTILVAAEDQAAAWDIAEEYAQPDPNDHEMDAVTGVDEVYGDGLTAAVRKKIPKLDIEEHNMLTVAELIEAGIISV